MKEIMSPTNFTRSHLHSEIWQRKNATGTLTSPETGLTHIDWQLAPLT